MLPEEKQLEKQQEERKTPPGICRDPAALRGLRPRPRALKYGMLRDGMGWEGMGRDEVSPRVCATLRRAAEPWLEPPGGPGM